MRRHALALVGAFAVLASACSGGSQASEPPPATRDVSGVTTSPPPTAAAGEGAEGAEGASGASPEPLDYEIVWRQLDERREEGTITVPLDYADPQGDTIDLYLVRHRADPDRSIGPLLANRGGPGADGATLALDADSWFRSEIIDNFDIIGWDPRGTGQSEGAVDCIDDDQYDRFYAGLDVTPDDEAERQALIDAAEEFAEGCIERTPGLEHLGTNNSARDMDAIRQALGVEQVSYFGWSYGSELGGVWATLFPTTVRAAVFDGAADPDADPLDRARQQMAGFEAALTTFLAACSDDSSCAFHNDGDAEGAFDALMSSLDESPAPSVEGRADLGLGAAITGVVQAMYSDRYWPALERALEDAAAGDGAGLLQLQDAYFRRNADGSYGNLIEAFQVIDCADEADRRTVEESDADAATIAEAAPRMFPYTTGSYSCTFFPEAADPRIAITGDGAGPIVVIGTTGDSATPLEGTRAMADTLEDGRLVIVEANQHTGYRDNDCVDDIVHEYLIQLVAPDTGVTCS